jgi:hypothetical protein
VAPARHGRGYRVTAGGDDHGGGYGSRDRASAVLPEPVPTTVDQAAVVEIPDDDAPPPGWGQWENWPAPAPEPAAGVLVMREDGCVMPR